MHCLMIIFVSTTLYGLSCSHGRLVDPPGRASAFRYGFNTPANYDDNQLYCGGKQVQQRNGGRCGVCGDPYNGPREHEAGGRFATGTIVKNYQPGQVIQVKVELTANHKGWMEFRLCSSNDPRKRVTQNCLDQGLLPLASGDGSRFRVSSDMGMITVLLRLPQDLTCSQCVLQWKYNAGNSWGTDSRTGESCVGCGPQEQFYGCADVAIGSTGSRIPQTNRNSNQGPGSPRREGLPPRGNMYPPRRGAMPPQRRPEPYPGRQGPSYHRPGPPYRINNNNRRGGGPTSDQLGIPQRNTGGAQLPMQNRGDGGGAQTRNNCGASAEWEATPGMDKWCRDNCSQGHCPNSHCICM